MRVNVSHKLSELVFKMLKSSSFFIDELLSIFNDMRIYIIYPICQYVRLYMYLVAVCVNFSTVFFFQNTFLLAVVIFNIPASILLLIHHIPTKMLCLCTNILFIYGLVYSCTCRCKQLAIHNRI